jgi:RNA polymerase sigma-70 factor (ECF subfamily)
MSSSATASVDATKVRKASFHALFERELDYVWTSLRRLGVHSRDVEDVAQEVFMQLHQRLDQYDPSRPIRPWLFAFAFRCASDWRRLSRHRVEASGDPDKWAGESASADTILERAQDHALVMAALERVDLERRAVLILYELDELPMKDIAEALGIPLFTAYSRLRVARQEFTAAVRRIQAQRGER